jgi:trigger factor
MDFIKTFTITPQEGSSVRIEGEVPYAEVVKHRAAALRKLGASVKQDGFRPGHVPEEIIVRTVGEGAILTDMAERTLAALYPEIVKAHNLDVIGYPEIRITKLAPENPLGFTATVAVLPPITLPDYTKIAKNLNKERVPTDVTDEELETQIKDILRQKLAYERLQAKAAARKDDEPETHVHEDGTVHEGPAHDHDDVKSVTDDELPELTDEYVQTLGQPGQFASVADFKAKLKEHLAIEKQREVAAAHRAKITDAIIAESTFELPKVMLDAETNQMFAQMEEDLTRANLTMEDYLGHIKKTREDLRQEWAPAAEKRARLQLVLNEIAKKEAIKPDQAEFEREVAHLLEHYKDADTNRVRVYVASILTNEAVMKMLENA